jgi:hypothetical protein
MRIRAMVAALCIAAGMVGCIPSLHPLYTEKDLVFDSSLLGTWVFVDPEENRHSMSWVFQKSKEYADSYDLTITEEEFGFTELDRVVDDYCAAITGSPRKNIQSEPGEPYTFEARLVRLGKYLFLDIFPQKIGVKNSYYVISMIPTHMFFKIKIKKNILRIGMMSPEWLEELIDQKEVNLKHLRDEERGMILTASTEELQKFIVQYAEEIEWVFEGKRQK